ncbi:prenyltransferase [Streptomyces solincola]|uniref:Prenyltransferase n=1 Tax=Streptomyces solincola TaxID=2100817 RepID=A0A2S9Q225_9ACTN|nr:UbiA family prenyltransferase [Streptomyces solincola]PRH80663.1 prenyltransferase [Streptomyces solincola]
MTDAPAPHTVARAPAGRPPAFTGRDRRAASAPAKRAGIAADRVAAWAELLRLPALLTVPGDVVAGTAAVGLPLHRGTAFAIGSSLCLYTAGMALNDWADRHVDAVERPERPLPSGRITPAAALAASCGLTAAGLMLAARAGRPAFLVAGSLAGTVWAYDLRMKHSAAGPAVMAAARSLDLLLGAASAAHPVRAGAAGTAAPHAAADTPRPSAPGLRSPEPAAAALASAALLGAHTAAVTMLSRREVHGGSTATPVAALATTALVARVLGSRPAAGRRATGRGRLRSAGQAAALAVYAATAGRSHLHAALNPSPQLTRRAVRDGIRAVIPLQAALALRHGAGLAALPVLALLPAMRHLSRRVSVT